VQGDNGIIYDCWQGADAEYTDRPARKPLLVWWDNIVKLLSDEDATDKAIVRI